MPPRPYASTRDSAHAGRPELQRLPLDALEVDLVAGEEEEHPEPQIAEELGGVVELRDVEALRADPMPEHQLDDDDRDRQLRRDRHDHQPGQGGGADDDQGLTSVHGIHGPGTVYAGRAGPRAESPGRRRLTLRAVISTNQFKNGTHIEVDGKIFKVVEFQHVKPGKGGAFVRSKLRRVDDGAVIDKTFKAGEKFRPVRTETKKMQYLYESGDNVVLMDNSSYEQVEIPKGVAEQALKWVPPNSEVDLLWSTSARAMSRFPVRWSWRSPRPTPVSRATRPPAAETSPRRWRPASSCRFPLFIEEGERVRVDTRSGEYVSRA